MPRSVSALVGGVSLLLATSAFAADKEITFWAPVGVDISTANDKVTTIEKLPGKVKLGKSCAGTAGKFEHWTVMTTDASGQRAPQFFQVAAKAVPAHGTKLASVRSGGECKEGSAKWVKYTGIVEEAKPKPKKKPATAAPAKKGEKKTDAKPK